MNMERWSTKMMLCIVKWMFDPMGSWIMLPSEGYSLATVLVLEESEHVWMCSSNDATRMDYSKHHDLIVHTSSKPEVLVVKLVMLPNLCYMSLITPWKIWFNALFEIVSPGHPSLPVTRLSKANGSLKFRVSRFWFRPPSEKLSGWYHMIPLKAFCFWYS